MLLIRHGYEITVSCPQPTPMVCMLTVQPDGAPPFAEPEAFTADPAIPSHTYRDLFGNVCRRLIAPPGVLTLTSDAVIRNDGEWDPLVPDAGQAPVQDLPDDCMVYLMGSRYCETDRMSQLAWSLFGQTAPGWARVQAICDFAHERIGFDYQCARPTRTAFEAYEEGTGVCRDFAHLALTLCRCMNIPARYVNGYLPDIGVPPGGPMDFCAWIEVYLDGRWRPFDPRNNARRIGRIVIARGRDAADVPLINSFGPHTLQSFKVWADQV
ncbi:transglutaminase family protein [Phenylobacterium sp.]|jgi:transglutaminase-like putative cysteine protease|uniref:transglutaminase-like domain-containing protein n=1 Tax=Phenylobacterium sp. TaxID=1871053 RepID=UPI002F419DFE